MSKYVGLDWAGKGWFGVVLRDDGNDGSELFPSILNAWSKHSDADSILIDIPIGLSTSGKRRCDVEAEKLLRPHRQNSVFPTPIRSAVFANTLSEAKKHNEEYGFSITNQAWSICPRIREVDVFLDEHPEAIGKLRESHPEACFATLNNDEPMEHSKKTDEGLSERKELLFELDESLEKIYRDAIKTFIEPPAWARRLSKNAEDDVLDAIVLAYTASSEKNSLPQKPEKREYDDKKRRRQPIEIVIPAV